jgi:hypothetical protein
MSDAERNDDRTNAQDGAEARPRVGIGAGASDAPVRGDGGDVKACAVRDQSAPRVDRLPLGSESAPAAAGRMRHGA